MNEYLTTESINIVISVISVISLIFAIWQYSKNIKTKKLISNESIELHKNVSFALGAIQNAKDAVVKGQSPSYEIGRAEGLCQAILHESAKLYCNIGNTKLDDIDDLISNGQLQQEYQSIYYSYSAPRRRFIRMLFKKIWRIF